MAWKIQRIVLEIIENIGHLVANVKSRDITVLLQCLTVRGGQNTV